MLSVPVVEVAVSQQHAGLFYLCLRMRAYLMFLELTHDRSSRHHQRPIGAQTDS